MLIFKKGAMMIHELIELVNILRKKCPWDRRQTLASLKNNVVEEAYELVEAIDENNQSAIQEEIGDILFLSLFLAKVLEEEKGINTDHVIADTIEKYRDKHPHVFKNMILSDEQEVLKFWQKNKEDIFKGIPTALPALLAAKVIQERASRLGFDWDSSQGPLHKVIEEAHEIEKSVESEKKFEELGDLLFACVNLARHLAIDPEDALRYANKKFVKRFRAVQEELKRRGKTIEDAGLEEMDKIWDELKKM